MDTMRTVAVVGGSLAGLEAARTLRKAGFDGRLVVLGAEPHLPYDRPAVSKELLIGSRGPDDVRLDLGDAADAEWLVGTAATHLDAATRTITIDGVDVSFDGIVVATGAHPVVPRGLAHGLAGVHVLRTLHDADTLRAELRRTPEVVVVGGGLIGCEVASVCRRLGIPVTLVEAESALLRRAVGAEASSFLTERAHDAGISLRLGCSVVELRGHGRVEEAVLSGGDVLRADVVVVAVGALPETRWLEGSGLQLDHGIVCDETCLAAPGIVAAGDVARWRSPRDGGLVRVEHWDNARRQGRHAALRLLGATQNAFDPIPWFWSDQLGGKLQVTGWLEQTEECLRLTKGGGTSFVALYRRGAHLTGAVTFGASRAMVTARQLLARGATWAEATASMRRAVDAAGSD